MPAAHLLLCGQVPRKPRIGDPYFNTQYWFPYVAFSELPERVKQVAGRSSKALPQKSHKVVLVAFYSSRQVQVQEKEM